jgi:hypothetical protein
VGAGLAVAAEAGGAWVADMTELPRHRKTVENTMMLMAAKIFSMRLSLSILIKQVHPAVCS